MHSELDSIDMQILALMQRDASVPVAEIAAAVGLSQSPCWRRIQRLEEQGYIRARVALLDPRKLGFNVEGVVQLRFSRENGATPAQFEAAIRALPEVTECVMLRGEVDCLLRVVTTDAAAFESFLRDRLERVPGVRAINSSIATSVVKSTHALPLEVLGQRSRDA